MKHIHKYEVIAHYGIPSDLMDKGIAAAEMRRCTVCQKEMPFVQTEDGKWLPLFEERDRDEQDILLA